MSVDVSAKRDVVIIGAGISGLTAAYFLRKQGFHVLVLEKNDRISGRTYLKQRHGITYAVGTQYLGEPQAALQTIYHDLSLSPQPYPTPFAAALSGGTLYLGEEGLLLRAVREAGIESVQRFVQMINATLALYTDLPDIHLVPPLSNLDRISALHWFQTEKISKALIHMISVEARSIFGVSLDEISALEYLAIASFAMPVGKSVTAEEAQTLREKVPFESRNSEWFGFPEGIFEIVRGIAKSLDTNLSLGCEMIGIEQDENGCLVHFRHAHGEASVRSKAVIVAVQPPMMQRISRNAIDAERLEILDLIQYSPIAIVSLFSQESIFDRAFILELPEGGRVSYLIDATWFQRGNGYLAPDSMRVLNALVVPTNSRDQRLQTETDDDLVNAALTEVEQAFPGARSKILDTDVTRHHLYGAYMPLGGYERIQRFHATNEPPIVFAGDYLRAAHFQASAETGPIAARKVERALVA